MNEDDIKQTFDSAFIGEPPLRIHRDEVLRKGRTRLIQRRLTITGGFAAVITVVALGASLAFSSNSAGQVDPVGTGFSSSPTTSSSFTSCYLVVPAEVLDSQGRPVSAENAPSSSATNPEPCEPMSEERARALTAVLADGDVVPAGFTLRSSEEDHPQPLGFIQKHGGYSASADLVAADGQEGTLEVMVGKESGGLSCGGPPECEIRTVNGQEVRIITMNFGWAGGIGTVVDVKRADGTHVSAITANISVKAQSGRDGKEVIAPTIDHQPFTVDQLIKIVTLPGLKF
ncbi:MAG: hypothetical protein ABIQ18_09760 [Umezawaea sp.]